jgi:tRNA threonylcarbamoyladenosine biosynthesis protein TsaE
VLARADVLVDELRAGAGADDSEFLRSSLTSRLAGLGEELRKAVSRSSTKAVAASPDAALADPNSLSAIEIALGRVQQHALANHRDEVRVGRALAGAAHAGDVICLWGDLGAGKTHLAKAFGAGFGVAGTITSPSFILMAEYDGRLPLFHIDLYRLADASDALSGGLIDDRQSGGVTLIEWPDRLGPALPAERLDVIIEGSGDEPRSIIVRAHGLGPRRYLEVVP